jgi:uncharacterized metal-binding protein
MSSGKHHEIIADFTGLLLTILLFYKHVPLEIIWRLVFGLTILSLWFSCDLDSPKSRPTQRWGFLKIIFAPFVDAGHREILHSKLWGAPILCFIPSIPILLRIYSTRDFVDLWILVGLTMATGLHIAVDYVSSGWNDIKDLGKKRFWRKVKKAIPFF